MSGTPVLLDVTDTPGEKGEVGVRQQPLGQQELLAVNASRTWWTAPVVGGLQTDWPWHDHMQSTHISYFDLDTHCFKMPPETS